MSAQANFLQEIPGYSFKLTPEQVRKIYKFNPQIEDVSLTIFSKTFSHLYGKRISLLLKKWKNIEVRISKSDNLVEMDLQNIGRSVLPLKTHIDLILRATKKYRVYYHVVVNDNEYSLSDENNHWVLSAYASGNEKNFLLFAKKLGLGNLTQVKKKLWPQPEKYVRKKRLSQIAFHKWIKLLPDSIGNITVNSFLSSVEQKKIIDLLIPKMPKGIAIDIKGHETIFHIYGDCVPEYEILLPFLGNSPKIDVSFAVKEKIGGKVERVILNEDNIRATWKTGVLRMEANPVKEKFGGYSYNYKKLADDFYNSLCNPRPT